MVKLRWLQVNKFRTVKPGTRLTFNPGYNVLLGQNSTGKTTLLNLVAAAIRSNFTEFQDLELDLDYELASGEATAVISVRHKRRTTPLTTAWETLPQGILSTGIITSDRNPQATLLSAEIKLVLRGKTILTITVEGSQLSVKYNENETYPGPPAQAETSTDLRSLDSIVVTLLGEWVMQNPNRNPALTLYELFQERKLQRFDESLEYFNRLSELRIDVIRHADWSVSSYGMFPGPQEMWEPLSTLLGSQSKDTDNLLIGDKHLPFLKRTISLLDFEAAEATIALQESSKAEEVESMHFGDLRFLFTHRAGWRTSERYLSYGQKRILAFMYYLATVDSVAVVDELVNGLHHRWIRDCIEALGQRQIFVTSQNPLLLDYLNFQSPEEVRSTFVLCRWERGPEQMVWENMSLEAAEDFFASYKVGFQQVGELLQSKGLW